MDQVGEVVPFSGKIPSSLACISTMIKHETSWKITLDWSNYLPLLAQTETYTDEVTDQYKIFYSILFKTDSQKPLTSLGHTEVISCSC